MYWNGLSRSRTWHFWLAVSEPSEKSEAAEVPGEPSRSGRGILGQSSCIWQGLRFWFVVKGWNTYEVPCAPLPSSACTVWESEHPEGSMLEPIRTWQFACGTPCTSGQKQKPLTVWYCPRNAPSVDCVIVGCANARPVMFPNR